MDSDSLSATIQAATSKHGLGACLLQNGKPTAFVLKSLKDPEIRYINTEREILAVVYACQHFHTLSV